MNQVLVVVLVNQVKKEKSVSNHSFAYICSRYRSLCVVGEAGVPGLPGLKGLPGDSGPCKLISEEIK